MKDRNDTEILEWLTKEIETGKLTDNQRKHLNFVRQMAVRLDQYREAYLRQVNELNRINRLKTQQFNDMTQLMQEIERLKADFHSEMEFRSLTGKRSR